MEGILIYILIGILALLLIVLAIYFLGQNNNPNLDSLMDSARDNRFKNTDEKENIDLDLLKKAQQKKRSKTKKKKLTAEDRFFQAGLYSQTSIRKFKTFRLITPIVAVVLALIVGVVYTSGTNILIIGFLGLILGLYLPERKIESLMKARHEDLLYYLPLVIEQISIGVSSALDIGPCISKVLEITEERDKSNPVIELLEQVIKYVKSGISLDEGLTEIGHKSGNNEVKHAFMALSQVVKHGGEISKQLQELALSVSSQRETIVDGQIKRLELSATGPVALVFVAFIVVLLISFGLQITNGF